MRHTPTQQGLSMLLAGASAGFAQAADLQRTERAVARAMVEPDDEDSEVQLLRAQAAEQRRYDRWRCPECGGGHGHHAQGCPEAIGEEVPA